MTGDFSTPLQADIMPPSGDEIVTNVLTGSFGARFVVADRNARDTRPPMLWATTAAFSKCCVWVRGG